MPTVDGTITYYIQPPSTYDQTVFDLAGDDDLYGSPGDQWRYYLVSGVSSNMTSSESLQASGPFVELRRVHRLHDRRCHARQDHRPRQVEGYVLVQGVMQWPNLNVAAESFADVQVYKAMSVLDTFPIGDPEVLIRFLRTQYPGASFVGKTVDGRHHARQHGDRTGLCQEHHHLFQYRSAGAGAAIGAVSGRVGAAHRYARHANGDKPALG